MVEPALRLRNWVIPAKVSTKCYKTVTILSHVFLPSTTYYTQDKYNSVVEITFSHSSITYVFSHGFSLSTNSLLRKYCKCIHLGVQLNKTLKKFTNLGIQSTSRCQYALQNILKSKLKTRRSKIFVYQIGVKPALWMQNMDSYRTTFLGQLEMLIQVVPNKN